MLTLFEINRIDERVCDCDAVAPSLKLTARKCKHAIKTRAMITDAAAEINSEQERTCAIGPPSEESAEESEGDEDEVPASVAQKTGGSTSDQTVYDQTNEEEDDSVQEK